MADSEFTDAEREFLCDVLAQWVHEGFTTPPYRAVFYDVAEKLGLTADDVSGMYDISRPSAAPSR